MIDFAGAEDRDFLEHFEFPGDSKIGQALGLDGFSNLVHLQAFLVCGSDQNFALVGIGTSNDSYLAILAVIRKSPGQSILHGG